MDRVVHIRDDSEDEPSGEEPKRKYCVFCRRLFDTQAEYLEHPCPKYTDAVRLDNEVQKRKVLRTHIKWTDVVGLVYTHNPFYTISAVLVLYGLNTIFGTSSATASPWALMGVIAAYTCLLALTGILIVRRGKVWEDVRSILMIVLVLFLALSVSFDEVFMSHPGSGTALLLFGLAFAVGLSEVVLRGLKIRLGWLFRGPYYAFLSFFFLYPIYLVQPIHAGVDGHARWALLLFPSIAGILAMSLIPAIRRGAKYTRDNGTPWKWPSFPWTLFSVLGVAVWIRAYYLTLSFDPAKGMESIFGAYFLSPFLLAVSILLLEMGLVSGRKVMQYAALVIPVVAIGCAFPGKSYGQYGDFVDVVLSVVGSPAFLIAAAAALFYVYAMVRCAKAGEWGLVLAVFVCSVVGSETVNLETLIAPRMIPILLIAAMEVYYALRYRSSWRAFLVTAGAMIALSIRFEGTWFNEYGGVLPVTVSYAALLTFGALFQDRLAKALQNLGAFVLPVLCFLTAFSSDAPDWAVTLYLIVMIGTGFWYRRVVDNPLYGRAAYWGIGLGVWAPGRWTIRIIESIHLPKGSGFVIWGGLAFAAAFAISTIKGRILRAAGAAGNAGGSHE
ncbi:hypothetical protein ACFL01_05100 [Planctomycetota bacterium]